MFCLSVVFCSCLLQCFAAGAMANAMIMVNYGKLCDYEVSDFMDNLVDSFKFHDIPSLSPVASGNEQFATENHNRTKWAIELPTSD